MARYPDSANTRARAGRFNYACRQGEKAQCQHHRCDSSEHFSGPPRLCVLIVVRLCAKFVSAL